MHKTARDTVDNVRSFYLIQSMSSLPLPSSSSSCYSASTTSLNLLGPSEANSNSPLSGAAIFVSQTTERAYGQVHTQREGCTSQVDVDSGGYEERGEMCIVGDNVVDHRWSGLLPVSEKFEGPFGPYKLMLSAR